MRKGGIFVNISISKGNGKLGSIQSVSLPAGVTCRPCSCAKKCYARRIERRRPSVAAAYKTNLRVLTEQPDVYWREVEAAIMLSRFFRFHVSGDIPNATYLYRMVEVAKRNPHCEILCFTKQYEFINSLLACGEGLPQNLHIVFSAWPGVEMPNSYNLPEAHIKFRDGTTTARPNAKMCNGNCTECAITDDGCWTLGPNEQVVFPEH